MNPTFAQELERLCIKHFHDREEPMNLEYWSDSLAQCFCVVRILLSFINTNAKNKIKILEDCVTVTKKYLEKEKY